MTFYVDTRGFYGFTGSVMRSPLKCAIVLFCTLFALRAAGAQVNVEKDRVARSKEGLSGSISLSAKLERGNSELTEIQLEPRLAWRGGRHKVMSINELSFVDAGEGSIVNDGFSHLRYNFELKSRLIAEAFLQGQYDRSQDISQRFLLGGGIRYMVVKQSAAAVAIGVAMMQEHEKLVSGETSVLVRNSDYISITFDAGDRFSATATTYVQPAVAEMEDVRLLSELNCTAWITGTIGMTVSMQYHYDSQPPERVKEYDVKLTSGLTLKF